MKAIPRGRTPHIGMLKRITDQLAATLRRFAGDFAAAAQTAAGKAKRGLVGTPSQSPLEPLPENGPPLPGTSDRAFWVGLVVVSLSVISGLATYLILTGLTPIVPRNDVVLTALIINVLLVIAMVAVIAVADDRPVARLEGKGGRRAAACPHRGAVQPDRRASRPAAGGRCHDHVLARARQLVQPADHGDRAELAAGRQCLPARARPGHPHRHRQHGARPRRCRSIHRRRPRPSFAS